MENVFGRVVKRSAMAIMLSVGLVSGVANAALIAELDGVVLDTVAGLEWEQNANKGQFVEFAGASAYVDGLTLDGGGWRLPTYDELSLLLNHVSAQTGCTYCQGDQGPFTGIIDYPYWSSSLFLNADYKQAFNMANGFGFGVPNDYLLPVWAVRDGDVAAPIPEPESYAMLLAGLGLLGFMARRRKQKAG